MHHKKMYSCGFIHIYWTFWAKLQIVDYLHFADWEMKANEENITCSRLVTLWHKEDYTDTLIWSQGSDLKGMKEATLQMQTRLTSEVCDS